MTKLFTYIFQFLIFPGFLFSSAVGLMVGWVDRKVTARLQWRVGPPWYQNFVDAIKLLFYKETLIPEGVSVATFLGMPLVALSAASLVSMMVLVINGSPSKGFVGDLIVIVYLLMIPPIALMLGAFASRNTLASLGSSREMKLMLSYELPFILSLAVPIIKSGYSIKLGDMIMAQAVSGPFIGSVSGVASFLAMLICIQAKLGFVPFDMPEAETEIMSGTCIEYSGKALGIFKLAKSILAFVIPALAVAIYFGGFKSDPAGFAKSLGAFLLVIVLMIVIKNTNPRVRIDQAIRFFWIPVTGLALFAVVLAFFGF